jgi:hypothetical protein
MPPSTVLLPAQGPEIWQGETDSRRACVSPVMPNLGQALVQVVECTVWHTCAKLPPHELTAGYRRHVEEGCQLQDGLSSLRNDLVVLGVVARVQRMIRPIHLVSARYRVHKYSDSQ